MTDTITLREFFEAHRISHQREHGQHEKEHERDHIATDQAIRVAVTAMDKRLDSMNEFRETLNSQQATFVRRDMLDAYRSEQDKKVDALTDLVEAIRREQANNQGRMVGIAAAFSVAVVIVNLGLRFL
jgi:hypothetical protein